MPTSAVAVPAPAAKPSAAPRLRLTPPLPPVAEAPRYVLADFAMRALLDEFLSRHGNRVRLTRIELENVGPDGEALENTHVGVEGVLLKPVAQGYERIDLSLGWSQKLGFREGSTATHVAVAPSAPAFPIDTGLCLTIERLLATFKGRGRQVRKFHHIVFAPVDPRKGHPIWSIDFTRHRPVFGPRREKATVDDVTGEASFQIL